MITASLFGPPLNSSATKTFENLGHRVQSYSRDKTYWIVQSRKLSYSRENSADIALEFSFYIDTCWSIHVLLLMVKIQKSLWRQLRIHCVFSVFIVFWKNRYSPTNKFETRNVPFSLFPRPNNIVSQQVCNFHVKNELVHTFCEHSVRANGLNI